MNPAHDALEALIQKSAAFDASTTQFSREVEGVFAAAGAAAEQTPAFKALAKGGKGLSAALLECAAAIGLSLNLQKRLLAVAQGSWKNSPQGQARAHEYVDLWGRATSLEALCYALLTDAEAGMAQSQLRARFEALIEGTTAILHQSAQALMAVGEVEIAARVVQCGQQRLKSQAVAELRGSILKELHAL